VSAWSAQITSQARPPSAQPPFRGTHIGLLLAQLVCGRVERLICLVQLLLDRRDALRTMQPPCCRAADLTGLAHVSQRGAQRRLQLLHLHGLAHTVSGRHHPSLVAVADTAAAAASLALYTVSADMLTFKPGVSL
jgi:hypothetical protein